MPAPASGCKNCVRVISLRRRSEHLNAVPIRLTNSALRSTLKSRPFGCSGGAEMLTTSIPFAPFTRSFRFVAEKASMKPQYEFGPTRSLWFRADRRNRNRPDSAARRRSPPSASPNFPPGHVEILSPVVIAVHQPPETVFDAAGPARKIRDIIRKTDRRRKKSFRKQKFPPQHFAIAHIHDSRDAHRAENCPQRNQRQSVPHTNRHLVHKEKQERKNDGRNERQQFFAICNL